MWLVLAAATGIFLTLILPWLFLPWYIALTLFVLLMSWHPERTNWLRRSAVGPLLRKTVGYRFEPAADAEKLDPEQQYIFALHPHGLLCFSEMLTFIFDCPNTELGPLAQRTVPLVATELLWLPLLGHWACALGAESADRENTKRLLAEGRSLALTPGGVREIKYASHNTERRIELRRSAAFLRLAHRKQVAVVPLLTLNEHRCYRFFPTAERLQDASIALFGWPFPMLAFGRFATFWPLSGAGLTLRRGSAVSPAETTLDAFIENYYNELQRVASDSGVELCFVQ